MGWIKAKRRRSKNKRGPGLTGRFVGSQGVVPLHTRLAGSPGSERTGTYSTVRKIENMQNGKETVKLITSIAWAGNILPAGGLLDADQEMAAQLIARERAALATAEEKAQAATAGQVPSAAGPWTQVA